MKVHELLDSPEKWIKKDYARDAQFNSVKADDPTAVCWCLSGAIRKCYGVNTDEEHAARFKVREVLNNSIPGFNDLNSTTFHDVRKLVLDLDI